MHRIEKVSTDVESTACGVDLRGAGPLVVFANDYGKGHKDLGIDSCGTYNKSGRGDDEGMPGRRVPRTHRH